MDNKPLKISIPKRIEKELAAAEAVRNQDYFNSLALESLIVGGDFNKICATLREDGATEDETFIAMGYAFDYVRNMSETTKTYELGKAKMRLEMLFLRAISTQNMPVALMVQKEINKLNHLYIPTKSERKEAYQEWLKKELAKRRLKRKAKSDAR